MKHFRDQGLCFKALCFLLTMNVACGKKELDTATDSSNSIVDSYLVAVTYSPSSIVIWKMTDEATLDTASEQILNWADFSNSGSFTEAFFGLAYASNKLYISGSGYRVYQVDFNLDSNRNPVVGTTLNVNGVASATEGSGNTYYLNNNIFNGVLFAGRIDEGIQFFNLSDWTSSGVSYYDNGVDGAKSACMVNGKIFLAGDDVQGVRRMDDISGANLTSYQLASNPGAESVVTDGTYLFTNDDVSRGVIRKYLPDGTGSSLTMTDQNGSTWSNPNIGGRIRGLSYSDNKRLYVSAAGNASHPDRAIYMINAETGASTALNASVPGTGAVYGVIRVAIPRP